MEKITAKDISVALNIPVKTVYICLCKNPGQISARKVELVRNYAEAVGYKNRDRFVAFCKRLRGNGCTNAEIAKAAGCTVPTVIRAIGRQPQEYTAYSVMKAGEDRARKNAARRERVEALRKAEAERKRAEISAQIAEAERQVEEYQMRWNEALQTASKCNHERVEKMRTIAELQKRLQEVA